MSNRCRILDWSRRNALPLRMMELEARRTPAVGLMGPHTANEVTWLQQTGGELWQVNAQAPAPQSGQISYVNAKVSVPSRLDFNALVDHLAAAPMERSAEAVANPLRLALPRPDGTYAEFRIWEYSMMEPGLSAQFPTFKTYQGQGVDDPSATIHLDVTSLGFHAQVRSPNGGWYVDPHWHLETMSYESYYRKDLMGGHGGGCTCAVCQLATAADGNGAAPNSGGGGPQPMFNNAGTLRTFRAAVAATGEYTAKFGGTQAGGQAAIVTMMNRQNQIYEGELAIRFVLVANNNTIVYIDANTDPYTDGNATLMVTQNQTTVDSMIGSANYDIGHVVGQAGTGGFAPGRVGVAGTKAQGATTLNNPTGDAFWVDFVAHEIGHQFNARHTFNSSGDNSQREAASAYEPGSGSTIMSYAGISGADNVQLNSDPYFHAHSLEQIINYIKINIPNVGTKTANGNNGPGVSTPPNLVIPTNTPFAIQIQAYDGNSDPLTITIEQRDLGPAQPLGSPDNGSSPLFRSVAPASSWIRYFPRMAALAANTSEITEVMPTTNRTMRFTATARDNRAGGGSFDTNDIFVQTVNTGAPFRVTSNNTSSSWSIGTKQTITWDVAGTTGFGINTSLVNIDMSTDGGLTYPITLAYNSPNDGSHEITVPNNYTSKARVKVTGVKDGWRTFYDINNANITIGAGNIRTAGLIATASPAYRPNLSVNFDFKVANTTSSTIGNFDVGFYVSKDQFITTGDRLLGVVNMPPIAGNTTVNPGATFNLPSQNEFWLGDGTYYVGMIVDYNNTIGETDELDNSNLGFGTDKQAVSVTQTADDPYEQNDTRETASKVLQNQPDVWLSSISGKARQHDEDFYKLVVPPQSTALARVTAEIVYDTPSIQMVSRLYVPPLYLSQASSFGTNGQTTLEWYGEPGDYYIAVGDFYGSTGNSYDVRWTVGPDVRGANVKDLKAGIEEDPILPNERLAAPVPMFIADFNEPMNKATVELLANWSLSLDGVDISDQITEIKYEQIGLPIRYEATLSLAGPIAAGVVELTASPGILDADGNPIDGNGDGTAGDEFARTFRIAAPSIQGGELGIPGTTAGAQKRPAIAMADNGNYITVWEGYGQDGDSGTESNIYARRFKANGTPLGDEFLVNQFTTGEQSHPAISADASGNFIVAWQSDGQDGDGFGIFARRYTAAGAPLDNEFKGVQFGTAGNQQHPAVALNADGTFSIAYESNEKSATNGYDILVLGAGGGIGSVFYPNLNQFTPGNQTNPSMAVDSKGQFIVTWQSENGDGDGLGISARGYTKFGAGSEIKVNSTTAGDQSRPTVDIDAESDAIVAWSSTNQDGDGETIVARRLYKAFFGFQTKGAEFIVNETVADAQTAPAVAIDADGDSVITWQSKLQDGDGYGIYARRYSLLGVAQGSEQLVNTFTTGEQQLARVASDFDGDFAVVWQSTDQDGDAEGIIGQRFGEPPPPPTAPIVTGIFGDIVAAGGTSYALSVTLDDDNAIDVSTLDSLDLRITGPNGFDVLATFDSVDVNTNGTPRVATYTFEPPGGAWDLFDNGVYVVSVETDQIGDVDLLFAPTGSVNVFQVSIADATAPTATVQLVDVNSAGGTNYSFTLTIADDFAVDVSTLDSSDVRVTGPNGFDVLATFVSVDDPTNGTSRVATYEFEPPGGAWDLGDDGAYDVAVEFNQIADASGNYLADGVIGTFNVLAADTIAPTAAGTFADVTTPGATEYTLTVTYSDTDAVDVATLDSNDIRVIGPNGFDVPADFVSVDVNTNGTPREATYRFIAPGGAWTAAGNGTYTITLQTDQVGDVSGNLATATAVGTFDVVLVAPPQISDLQINDGSAQRSRVTSLTITFDSAVTLPANPADAFELKHQGSDAIVTLDAMVTGNTVILTFTGGPLNFGSLADGRYTLTALAAEINGGDFDGNGDGLGGDDYILIGSPANGLFRLFGDADGNGTVNTVDFNAFRTAFGGSSSIFDFDNAGGVGTLDFNQFRVRFGSSV